MKSINVQVVETSLSISDAMNFGSQSGHGAMSCFVGVVRDTNLGRQVRGMEYDCFVPLCLKVFREIAIEATEKWGPSVTIFIVHRTGWLNIGEASVVLVAKTPHRDEAFRITRYLIEEIKVRAPIWKKEHYIDGATDWVRGHALCQHRKVDHHDEGGSHSCGGEVHSHETR